MQVSYRTAALLILGTILLTPVLAVTHPVASVQAALYTEGIPNENAYTDNGDLREQVIFDNAEVPENAEETDYYSSYENQVWTHADNGSHLSNYLEVKYENKSEVMARVAWNNRIREGTVHNTSATMEEYRSGDLTFLKYVNRTGDVPVAERAIREQGLFSGETAAERFDFRGDIELEVVSSRHVEGIGTVYRLKATGGENFGDGLKTLYVRGYIDVTKNLSVVESELTVINAHEKGVISYNHLSQKQEPVTITPPEEHDDYLLNATHVDWNTVRLTNTGDNAWEPYWSVSWHGVHDEPQTIHQTIQPGETVFLNLHRDHNSPNDTVDIRVSDSDYDSPMTQRYAEKVTGKEPMEYGRFKRTIKIQSAGGWPITDKMVWLECDTNVDDKPACPEGSQEDDDK